MNHKKIIVGIGGNLFSKEGLHPVQVCQEAIKLLKPMSIIVEKQSSWYRSDPIPKSDQPKFFNSILVASTTLNELDVLNSLHVIEKKFGRIRKNINEARIIDLDLIDYSSKIYDSKDIVLPHPRAHLRRFVMQPLYEIEKKWIHPILKISVAEILNQLETQELELFSRFK